jgi:hypothetical protein
MIGHQTELTKLMENIQKGQPTLLLGDIGVGKSYLLRQVQADLDKAIYVETMSPLKSALFEILQVVHRNDDLEVEGVEAEYLAWPELLKKLNRLNIKELIDTIVKNIKNKEYVLLLDHLENATPSMAKRIETMMEYATLVGAANKLKSSLKKLWWRFEKIEIPPLNKDESRELLWSLLSKDNMDDAQLLEQIVLNQANGNPLSIIELAQKAQHEENLSPESIRELKHQAGVRFIDITPIFFVVGALVIATRFIALGLNSTELYIFAGVAGGFFMGLRYFLYRSMRGDE